MAALLSLFAATNTHVVIDTKTFATDWLPFIGTLVAAVITSLVSYVAYRSSKRTSKKQEKIQGDVAVLTGFNDLTERLQDELKTQQQKVTALEATHKAVTTKLQGEVEECNADRQDLRMALERTQVEVRLLREMVLRQEKK